MYVHMQTASARALIVAVTHLVTADLTALESFELALVTVIV